MNKISLILFLFVVLLMGCNKKNKNDFLSDTKSIQGELINVDFLIGKPYKLISNESLLFICDPYESKVMTVFDVRNKKCHERILEIGNGPGEVSGSLRFSFSAKHNQLYIFQIQSGIFNTYNISGKSLTLIESIRIEERPANVVATEEALVGIGPFEEGRYHIYDKRVIFLPMRGRIHRMK